MRSNAADIFYASSVITMTRMNLVLTPRRFISTSLGGPIKGEIAMVDYLGGRDYLIKQ